MVGYILLKVLLNIYTLVLWNKLKNGKFSFDYI